MTALGLAMVGLLAGLGGCRACIDWGSSCGRGCRGPDLGLVAGIVLAEAVVEAAYCR